MNSFGLTKRAVAEGKRLYGVQRSSSNTYPCRRQGSIPLSISPLVLSSLPNTCTPLARHLRAIFAPPWEIWIPLYGSLFTKRNHVGCHVGSECSSNVLPERRGEFTSVLPLRIPPIHRVPWFRARKWIEPERDFPCNGNNTGSPDNLRGVAKEYPQ